jgi:hypothetical protein
MPKRRIRQILLSMAAVAVVAGCAGQPERPVAQLTRASTLIEQAERTGAARFAAADIEQARGKLSRAEAAAEEGDQAAALRLAQEAAVDAELAQARASAAEAKQAEQELQQSLQTLREEAGRGPGTGGS